MAYAYRLLSLTPLLLFSLCHLVQATPLADSVTGKLTQLEKEFGGRIGVYAIDTGSGQTFAYRAEERFPLCSSFKGFLAGAILLKSQQQKGLLDERIRYEHRTLEEHSPMTEKNKSTGMTVAELSAAAVQYSDNGATNLLLEKFTDGPEGLTSFMRSIGDHAFRLDRWEPELNRVIPGDERDTSTPNAVANSLQKLVFGHVLEEPQRQQLQAWLKGSTTGAKRIRAGVPADWRVGDKTGTCGVYGAANDYAVIWPKHHSPLILAVYTARPHEDATHSDTVIAEAARLAIQSLAIPSR